MLALAALMTLSGCREQILHSVTESKANQIISRLNDNRIAATKSRGADGGWSIEVARGEESAALKLLTRSRLLREKEPEPAESGSLLASPEEGRFRYERALSRELGSTLSRMAGVLEARVHLNLPPGEAIFLRAGAGVQGSGSVFLAVDQSFAADREAIAHLVADAAGLESGRVSVLVDSSGVAADVPDTLEVAAAPATPEGAIWSTDNRSMIAAAVLSIAVGFIVFGARVLLRSMRKTGLRRGRVRSSEARA